MGSATSRLSFGARAVCDSANKRTRLNFTARFYRGDRFLLEAQTTGVSPRSRRTTSSRRSNANKRGLGHVLAGTTGGPTASPASASEIRPPAARLNHRPKLLTVSSQHSQFNPNLRLASRRRSSTTRWGSDVTTFRSCSARSTWRPVALSRGGNNNRQRIATSSSDQFFRQVGPDPEHNVKMIA